VSWGLFRPESVANLIDALPETYRSTVFQTIVRVLANPYNPVGCTVDVIQAQKPGRRNRHVVDAAFGVFITYEILHGVPPLMDKKFVRIVAITELGEYQRPF
jgi:hypothetical protein